MPIKVEGYRLHEDLTFFACFVFAMFRSLLIVVTLTGMALCQYRCMATQTLPASDGRSVQKASGCGCCHTAPISPERPSDPCCPGDDGDCHCQGVCGGAVTGDPVSLDQLMLVWAFALRLPVTVRNVDTISATRSPFSDTEPSRLGAEDGRALRILISSFLT
ncbi:MAG: hypothetical protein H0T47_04355 [Planctomycetaceae bacterium]|nr:hypothetical protein [Planctomycetaceae bacterium]